MPHSLYVHPGSDGGLLGYRMHSTIHNGPDTVVPVPDDESRPN